MKGSYANRLGKKAIVVLKKFALAIDKVSAWRRCEAGQLRKKCLHLGFDCGQSPESSSISKKRRRLVNDCLAFLLCNCGNSQLKVNSEFGHTFKNAKSLLLVLPW